MNKIEKFTNVELENLDARLDELIQLLDTEANEAFIRELKAEKNIVLVEMTKRFSEIYTPSFKVGYGDGSGMYTITDTEDEPVIPASNYDSGIRSRMIARVLVELLNNSFDRVLFPRSSEELEDKNE